MAEILSPNMLKTFDKCPKKFFFKYIKGISMPVDNKIFTTGKNIHALASYYLKKENIDNMELALTEKEKNIWDYLKNCKYFSYEVIGVEYSLFFKIKNYIFGGRLDALVKQNDRYYILDYKTGSAPKNAKYDFQTMIYLMAVSSYFKSEDVTFVYLDLKNREETLIELSEELVREYKQKLIDTAEKTEKSDFRTTKKKRKNCEYGIICYDKKLSD